MDTDKKYDLCIIGCGPAGIMLAMEYIKINPSAGVLMVEFGQRQPGKRNILDDSIVITNEPNHHPPYECTNKGFGGTSLTWGGRCVMFDEVDFIPRPVLKDGCTWDRSVLKEIQPYLARTSEYFECGSDVFNLQGIEKYRDSRIAEGFKEGIVTDSRLERWSMPTRFGQRYRKELEASGNVLILEGYMAGEFSEPDEIGTVDSLKVYAVGSDEARIIRASGFVISAGAQESTRILLKNPGVFKHNGGTPEALGHYYQGHLSGKIASVHFSGNPKLTDYGFIRDEDGTYIRRRFQFSTDFLVAENLLNTAIWLDNPLYNDPSHRNGAMSFMYLAMITPFLGKKLAPPAIKKAFTKGKKQSIFRHILNVIKDLPGSLWTPASIFYRRYMHERKLPGVFLYNPQNVYALHFHSEQVPEYDNCMKLADQGNKLEINYSLSDDDISSVIRLHDELDRHLRSTGCGMLEYWYPKEELKEAIRSVSSDGIHQCGTTRMSDDPENGVVDRNLKVFGTTNLYVCSSSVFPTSGQANPTYLLGAFALRLADHLSEVKAEQQSNMKERM